MVKSSTTGSRATDSIEVDGKKSVPITHVILKRVTDVKMMVSDLQKDGTRGPYEPPVTDLQTVLDQQSAELHALQKQLETFQGGLLESIQATLTERFQELAATGPASSSSLPLPAATSDAIPPSAESTETGPSTSPGNLMEALAAAKSAVGTDSQGSSAAHSKEELAEAEEPQDTWASIRSAFLNEHDVDSDSTDSSAAFPSATPSESTLSDSVDPQIADAASNNTAAEFPEQTVLDLPELEELQFADDLNSLNEEQLRETVEKQERIISSLIRKLQTRFNKRPTLTNEQLETMREHVDPDLAASIDETLALLQRQLRQGELELSLERARLSRRRTDLEQLDERIQGRARTLGITINEDGTIDDAKVSQQTGTKARRWLGAMGFSEDS